VLSDFFFSFQPRELKIEVTGACDLACSFCYQGLAVGAPGRHAPEDQVLGWIDWAVDNDIPMVRFTGGEPTLHPAIKVFCNYAHLRGRFIILNTNGLAPEGLYADLLRVVHHLHLSLPVLDPGRMDAICGARNVLSRKMALMRQALEAGRGVGLLTALLPENKGRLEEFVLLAREHPGASWSPLRMEATPVMPRPWSRQDAGDFAREVAQLMELYPQDVKGIRLATPFCAVEPLSLGAKVFMGRAEQCGPYHSLVAGLDGRLRGCYCIQGTLETGTLAEIAGSQDLWNCAALASLPEECQACPHVARCGGGCRAWPGLVEHRGRWVDHLAGFIAPARGVTKRHETRAAG
jgi:radical SAM protein with 4Fe4S-binding SPASM domain